MPTTSSADFRYIETRSAEPAGGEKIFRAAVSAFCALTRPSKREIAQLDDLAMPLVGNVSREGRRFAAAALSECKYAPPTLVRHLAGDFADVAAPLLIRSEALRDVDLISLIANCDLAHARAIARRTNLVKPIHDLLTAMQDPEIDRLRALANEAQDNAKSPTRGQFAAEARQKLRRMMRPANNQTYHVGLRESALTGRPALFQTALADALGLEFEIVRRITESDQLTEFSIALKALDVGPELAFLMVSALRPIAFPGAEQIRWFLSKYDALVADKARETVRSWKLRAKTVEPAFGKAS